MNISEAIQLKREIQASCEIEVKMLDTAEDGFVLFVERKALDVGRYKLLADFVAKKGLNLQLDLGNFMISNHALSSL